MQLHDILLLRTSAILPEAISAGGGLTPTTDTSLFLTTYRGGVISQLIYFILPLLPLQVPVHRAVSDQLLLEPLS